MAAHGVDPSKARRWAEFRLKVIGRLLASPPPQGELQAALGELARTVWTTPQGSAVTFGVSTLERWYYRARGAQDPIASLMRLPRGDRGVRKAVTPPGLEALRSQYAQHPGWSYQLHADNLAALCASEPERFGSSPSYSTVRREMHRQGWFKRKKAADTEGKRRAHRRLEQRETRSFEAECVHALWHFDFHHGRRKVIDKDGNWHKPLCLCILDDCSRLCCHVQWYLGEGAEELAHGLMQAFAKRGLPRSVIHDNGAAMKAAEVVQGWRDLSITQEPTLDYSPQQNGKQEVFWAQLEGRLMAMIENVEPLTLDFLNRASVAWAEVEYHNRVHDELAATPLKRASEGTDVSRDPPEPTQLRRAFTAKQQRTQRRSDGTVSIEGVRFELPNRLRTVRRPTMRYARWDLSQAWVVDPDSNSVIASVLPIDKNANARGARRTMAPVSNSPVPEASAVTTSRDPLPPLMRKILEEYAATGLPPAFIPKV